MKNTIRTALVILPISHIVPHWEIAH